MEPSGFTSDSGEEPLHSSAERNLRKTYKASYGQDSGLIADMPFSNPSVVTPALSELPNISFALDESLRRAGIRSPAQLRSIGAEGAWYLLRGHGNWSSVHTLFALEGAIQGVPWQKLPATRRGELMRRGSAV